MFLRFLCSYLDRNFEAEVAAQEGPFVLIILPVQVIPQTGWESLDFVLQHIWTFELQFEGIRSDISGILTCLP